MSRSSITKSSLFSNKSPKPRHQCSVDKSVSSFLLHKGVTLGSVELVQYALGQNSAVDSVVNGVQPVHLASCLDNPAILQTLLQNGGQPNARRLPKDVTCFSFSRCPHLNREMRNGSRYLHNKGSTPLHFAGANGKVGCVEVLLQHGALVEVADEYGFTPLDVASAKGYEEVVSLLRHYQYIDSTAPTHATSNSPGNGVRHSISSPVPLSSCSTIHTHPTLLRIPEHELPPVSSSTGHAPSLASLPPSPSYSDALPSPLSDTHSRRMATPSPSFGESPRVDLADFKDTPDTGSFGSPSLPRSFALPSPVTSPTVPLHSSPRPSSLSGTSGRLTILEKGSSRSSPMLPYRQQGVRHGPLELENDATGMHLGRPSSQSGHESTDGMTLLTPPVLSATVAFPPLSGPSEVKAASATELLPLPAKPKSITRKISSTFFKYTHLRSNGHSDPADASGNRRRSASVDSQGLSGQVSKKTAGFSSSNSALRTSRPTSSRSSQGKEKTQWTVLPSYLSMVMDENEEVSTGGWTPERGFVEQGSLTSTQSVPQWEASSKVTFPYLQSSGSRGLSSASTGSPNSLLPPRPLGSSGSRRRSTDPTPFSLASRALQSIRKKQSGLAN
ncbi:hypothetical protein IWQ62_002359 [Dispira parvispora]|uniref:Uncharacterized protein n=1 Tax=Dispira parvispora TaxID=1520584 RepID=A0A9W8AWW3_9FUNG|nr:hypothetical protein IWQ62_002359 [Dispira parvispora]